MGNDNLTLLLVAMMDAGDVPELDLMKTSDAHRALVLLNSSSIGKSICSRLNTRMDTLPDPDVGLRVQGLTKAIWVALGQGLLNPTTSETVVALTGLGRVKSCAILATLSEAELRTLAEIGHHWTCRSTSRKTRSRAPESFAFM